MCKASYPQLCVLVIFIVLAPTRASNVTFECPSGWDIIGTHCYNFINIQMDFEDARDVCDGYGAQLLVVRDEVEASNVSSVALKRFTSSEQFWIYNGRYEQDSGKGSLNSTFCKGMWQPNEPRKTDENVAISSNMQGRWALTWVWSNLPFVCRTPACPVDSFRCTDGTCLNKKWKCDGTYDCKDLSDENDCTGDIRYYTNITGTVDTSNSVIEDFNQWIIEGHPGEVLRIEFDTLTIEDHVDSVKVYSGGPSIMTSDLIQDIRKSQTKKLSLFSKNHYVIVTLQSYAQNIKPVLKFNWTSDNEASWEQVQTVNVTNSDSLISSPYFNSSLAPVSFKREWLLTAPEGELITLEVLDNTLELNASSDFYIVTNVGFVLKELNSRKAVYISSRNSMSVIIKTKSLKKHSSFSARLRKGCDFVTKLSLATFTLKNLPANLTCSWKVQNEVASNFSLQINETSIGVSSDVLQIYSRIDRNSTKIDTLNYISPGLNEYESVSGGVSFIYVSDTFHPGVEFSGKISADCPDLQISSNMNVIYNKTKTAGEAYGAHLSCLKGFKFKQEEYSKIQTLFAVCNEGGTWDWGSPSYTRTPECQIAYCGFPPAIPYGFVNSINVNITYNSVASYQCFSGFQLIGASTNVTCQANGSWSVTPSCVAQNCSEILNVPHGNSSNASDVSGGSVVIFSCDPGYSLQGPRTIACLSNKTWSHHQPECKESTCPLPVLEHGHYEHKSIPKFGESVSLLCDSGYQINRTQSQNDTSITCSVNRKLSVENDICVDADECSNGSANNCSATENCVNLVGSYSCVCKSGFHGTDCKDVDECALGACHQNCTDLVGSYSCSCYDGYILYTENGTSSFYMPAGEDGLKPGDVFQINNTCVPVTCNGVPEPPANGTVLMVKSIYYYNESVNIVCSFGYILENPSFATCQSDGNWTYSPDPVCKKMTCPQPQAGEHEASRVPIMGDIEPGASLTITCNLDDGSGNVINKTLFCAPSPDAYGQFSLQGDDPACPEVNCGGPLDISGGNYTNLMNTTYGSTFEFDCDSSRGFTVAGMSTLGNTTVECQSNGRWGFANLTCEGPRCQDPGTMGGTIQIVKTSYEIDQIVQYNCTKPGFTPVTNDTLVCEYKNGHANWSDNAPICEDTEAPVITCPSVGPFDLYSTLVYPNPIVTDNSGITCFMIESGPPSGVSLVSRNNMTVKYKAIDTRNEAICEFNVTLKDRTEPAIECPSPIQRDLTHKRNELFNLTKALLVSQSGDGVISFHPIGPLNLTVGSVFPVRANITKDNGLVKECAFLVSAVSTTCVNDSLSPPNNGKIENCAGSGNKMTCTGICDKGYLFKTASNSTSYSCVNGTWDMDFPVQPCIKISDLVYDFHVTIQYRLSGSRYSPPSYSDPPCFQQHCSLLSQHVENISACGYNNFTVVNCSGREMDSSSDETSFTLQLLTTDGNETSLKSCVDTLQNLSETLFGPTYPVVSNWSCHPPWSVNFASVNIVPVNVSCSKNTIMVDSSGTKYCLPCGPGMFFNTTTEECQECQDGYYQTEEGKEICKQCPQGVVKSYKPRTKESHCFELCPDGFMSTSGYIEDNCTACPEDHFSLSPNSCQSCPKNGSTLGVSGAASETQCSDPCSPGEYSITGYEPCSLCPKNFYSISQGEKMCEECPSNTYTADNGSISFSDCQNGDSLCNATFCNTAGTVNVSACEIQDHRPVCVCKPGFYGDSCNKSCDVCNHNPCYNQGLCTASGLNFTCTCTNETTCVFNRNQNIQYTSNSSIVLISLNGTDKCEELCLNNTNCVAYLVENSIYGLICYQYNTLLLGSNPNNYDFFVKNCSEQQLFDGPLCEKDLKNDCNPNVCANIDFCMDLVGRTECRCPHDGGSYDSKCAKPDNSCQGNNCSHHGKCIPYGSVRAVCECNQGYTGDRCQTDINECGINNHGCLYNGSCQDGVNTYNCSCVNGFSGSHCEVPADFCSPNDCDVANGGICTNDFENVTASCTCGEHYRLDSPNSDVCVPINYCLSSPCINGTCIDVTGGFRCDCIMGFEGSRCQHNIDDCINHMCKNGATCIDGVSNYTCTCPTGFTGSFCEENTDDCFGKCVVNNTETICQDLVEDYYCPCKPAYTGKNCSETVNMCTVYEPCLHGGNCSDFSGGYKCTCPAGWTGTNCEQEINYCSSRPCQNMGICYNLMDQYFCKCPNGTAGKTCGQIEKLCDIFNDSACSSNGNCELVGGTIRCQCLGEYSGKSCELEKDYCADNPCNGGLCILSHPTYECDCSNVKNYSGKNCNETKIGCSTCPKSAKCHEFEDLDGYLKSACMCHANETLVGDTCKTVDKDYDLAFLESFADKGTFITSESGFYLDKNTSLSITMWVAAAKQLNNDQFILALRSSKMNQPFLSVFNKRVQFTTSVNIPVELTDDIGITHSLDESFTWHLISIVWSTNGSLEIIFDFITLFQTTLAAVPPSDEFVFVQLGQSFYGYISQVSVWKTVLSSSDQYEMYRDKLVVPQPDSLLLGWTQYSFDSSVKRTKNSTAVGSFSVCDIPNTIAKMGLNRPECKNRKMTDKTPPQINYCSQSTVMSTDYSKHQVNSSDLGYEFTDDTDGNLPSQSQLFSYGAYDIAVSAKDSAGNIGVCMTRAYITPNKCSDTEPSQNYLTNCSDNLNGRQVTCPPDMLPSVPTPNFVSCSNLLTYNLDNLYEKPDRIVCGMRNPIFVTVNMVLPYRIVVNCDDNVVLSINERLKASIMTLNKSWLGLCSDKNCNNVIASGNCTSPRSLEAHVEIRNLNGSLSSSVHPSMTPLEIIRNSVADRTAFDFSVVADAHLENKTKVDEVTLCDKGYSLSGIYCVQCGSGSYYHEGEMKCKLCELNTYSVHAGNTSCTNCSDNKVTLQRGSSSVTDCKEKCQHGQMLNFTTNTCVPCPKNFYQDHEGKSYCFPCPPATGTENNGTTSPADCKDICMPGTELKGQGCVECQRGFYRPGGLQDPCSPCPLSNYTTKGNGSISEADCNIPRCAPGYFVQGNDSFTCQPCDYGTYQPNEAEFECLPCSKNFTTENTGETNASMCRVYCPEGEEDIKGTCVSCPDDLYKQSTSHDQCLNCTGDFTSTLSNRSYCTEMFCDVGRELKAGNCSDCDYGFFKSSRGNDSCIKCPLNTTTASTASTSDLDCSRIVCPAGSYRNENTNSCYICPRGTYQELPGKNNCEPCMLNFTTQSEGSNNSSQCYDKCKKGYYRDRNSTESKLCPVGEYESCDISLNVEACTPCPNGTTTLLEGAPTQDGYCIQNCSEGEEYHMTLKNCTACPIGMYRPEGVREPPTCFLCPSGSTTLKTGDSKCIQNQDTTLPDVKIDLSIVATISVQECSNPQAVTNAIDNVVLKLIQNQNNRYNGLCVNNCKTDVEIKIDDLCGQNSRSKRQTGGKATVDVMIKGIDAVLKRNVDGLPRPSMAVLMEAFYDLYPVEDLLTSYQLSFDSVKGVGCGQQCIVSSFHYPQICVPGQFIGADECEPCSHGSYSTDPVSKTCEFCPGGQTTATDGARNKSSCDGICATDNTYCGSKGDCTINSEGKSFCACHSDYFGHSCSQRQTPEDSNIKIVVGVTVGVGGFLLILLIIFGCCAYKRHANRKSRSTSLVSESDTAGYRFPIFNPVRNNFDPPMYHGETIDLRDNNLSADLKNNGISELPFRLPRVKASSHSHFKHSSDDWD